MGGGCIGGEVAAAALTRAEVRPRCTHHFDGTPVFHEHLLLCFHITARQPGLDLVTEFLPRGREKGMGMGKAAGVGSAHDAKTPHIGAGRRT